MIDKFIGDGALIVFGVTGPAKGAAAQALSFARDLLGRIETMPNIEQGQTSTALRIGIGVHYGEVFCGFVGDDDRLEFTVLGDTVNVASRLEGATKRLGAPLLISAEALLAAQEPSEAWRVVSNEALPGRQAATLIYAGTAFDPSVSSLISCPGRDAIVQGSRV